jgi:hypothetical protein
LVTGYLGSGVRWEDNRTRPQTVRRTIAFSLVWRITLYNIWRSPILYRAPRGFSILCGALRGLGLSSLRTTRIHFALNPQDPKNKGASRALIMRWHRGAIRAENTRINQIIHNVALVLGAFVKQSRNRCGPLVQTLTMASCIMRISSSSMNMASAVSNPCYIHNAMVCRIFTT